MSVPRLVVAAPSSRSGKTTVATGLMAAFAARGLAVSPHKVGPDYIDPGYHALATGRPGRNLDPYLCGPERIAPLFLHGARGCELAVVEGVMGLFDGAAGLGETASTAHVAKLLRAPVVLVVDASAQARSVAALVHGFASFDTAVRLGGVILNKVGSDRHEAILRKALEESGVPVLGVLRRDDVLGVPARHLGLIPATERATEAAAWTRAVGDRVSAACDLPALLSLARSAPPLTATPWDPAAEAAMARAASAGAGTANAGSPGAPPTAAGSTEAAFAAVAARAPLVEPEFAEPSRRLARPVVAVARGAAFTFAYAEHEELLAASGAEVVGFDPLDDEELPEGTAGLVIGGGFPEVYGPQLSANASLRRHVAAFTGPIAAECAGLLYLVRELDGHPMCGVVPAKAAMTERLTLGYREAVAVTGSVLAAAGTRMRGHEFHRTRVEPGAGPDPAWGLVRPERRTEGFVQARLHASYLHTHWAADPSLPHRFVTACAIARTPR
ncbi:hydrogenobyrinic acid a,c-diamide synthase (glutamine-hydrolysing) /cobyrinate a,c-diamide synthase [Actinacidiphila guanduensis]|uniref:Hydrogenobyrinate a,c-diamide synthase n=1 Tax=Actinacidiphila guanduensis TaxID=310781 RepID=A0A1H0E4I6_9ACTN|nr:hydrogenobyrinic acid a,c-diamide synthase (glutamine-hydrolysing) /cobyrinate a,c-diamide synthase [Actinacidiphila guanduensis]